MKSIYKTPKINGVERKYLSGGNLKEYLENAEVFSYSIWNIEKVKQFADLALALSNNLEDVHAIDFFHGDIHPNNSAEAIIEENDTQLSANIRYLPPERTGFVKVTGNAQSDLYSLGVSLYELASRRELFNGNTAKEIVTLILSHIPQYLSSILKDLPKQLSDIIDKSIRKNPADSYQTAAGLSADLKICQI